MDWRRIAVSGPEGGGIVELAVDGGYGIELREGW